MDWKQSNLNGRCFALATNLPMFRCQVSFSLFLKVGGPKAKAKGGAESQPSRIPPADALCYVGVCVGFQAAERTLPYTDHKQKLEESELTLNCSIKFV